MALPTGQISLSQVNVELGLTSTATISLNQANVRSLAGVSSGAISMENLQGKSSEFAFSIVSNQTNANLATLATNAGWNGSSKLVATINSGVVIGSTSASAAFTISGSYPGGVELINNGTIAGKGGNGAVGPINPLATTIEAFRGGGGGGGAGSNVGLGAIRAGVNGTATSGGAGGPANQAQGGGPAASAGNAGANGFAGGLGLSATSAVAITNNGTIAGGGGGGGSGGSRFQFIGGGQVLVRAEAGGAGGSRGAVGGAGQGQGPSVGGAGGAAGAAISGNSNITYLATGTRLGAIS